LEMGRTCCCCGCCSSKSEEELGEVPADTTLALVASFSLGDFFFHGQLRRELSFSFSFSMATKPPLYNLQLLLMMMRLPLISKTFSLSLELVLLNRPPSGGNVCMRDPSPTRREECRRMLGHYMKSVQSFELELSPSSTNSSSLPP
jgi:hypothetical protein